MNSIKKRFKFSLSRPYVGKVKTLTVKRNHLGEFFIVMELDKAPAAIRKTHNGALVGIDFGLKKYMTLSDGSTVDNPQFQKSGLRKLQCKSRNLSKCKPGSHNRERKRPTCQNTINFAGDITYVHSHVRANLLRFYFYFTSL